MSNREAVQYLDISLGQVRYKFRVKQGQVMTYQELVKDVGQKDVKKGKIKKSGMGKDHR